MKRTIAFLALFLSILAIGVFGYSEAGIVGVVFYTTVPILIGAFFGWLDS